MPNSFSFDHFKCNGNISKLMLGAVTEIQLIWLRLYFSYIQWELIIILDSGKLTKRNKI